MRKYLLNQNNHNQTLFVGNHILTSLTSFRQTNEKGLEKTHRRTDKNTPSPGFTNRN